MRNVININIPEPCHENWSTMTPNEKGRHCALCKKTVFDFTAKTDEYIVKTFTDNKDVCGRFKTTQLQRDLVLSRKENNSYLSFVASGLFAFLGLYSPEVFSQGQPKTVKTEVFKQHSVKEKNTEQEPKPNTDSIYGTIKDTDKLPLPGATILIKGTTKGAISDFDGEFTIDAKTGDILVVSYLGFITQEIKITNKTSKIILLELDEEVLGGIVVVGYATTSCSTEYVPTAEEIARKKQIAFARKNGKAFYKRLKKERKEKIKNGEIERRGLGKLFSKIFK